MSLVYMLLEGGKTTVLDLYPIRQSAHIIGITSTRYRNRRGVSANAAHVTTMRKKLALLAFQGSGMKM